jgi:site-specific DNA-cytosine methylase
VTELVLSLFPGLDVLGMGFERVGFCVVQGPDAIWGRSIREFHPPAGRWFDGVIGGDPCQAHSALSNLVRAKGLEPSFPDMTGEFERVVEAARPRWFLRENVPKAPDCKPQGYEVHSFLLDHSHLDAGDGTGHEQMRRRRFWFGVRDGAVPDLRRWIDFALFELPNRVDCASTRPPNNDNARKGRFVSIEKQRTQAVAADSRAVPVRHGGSGKVKVTAVGGHDGHADALGDKAYRESRERGEAGFAGGGRSLEEMLRLQGLPEDLFEYQGAKSPYTVQAKRKLVGNCVPLPMAEALGKAVMEARDGQA